MDDVRGRYVGIGHRELHRTRLLLALGLRCGNVMCVASEPNARDLGIDFRTASPGMLLRFEDYNSRALTHDKPVTVLVIGTRCASRVVIARRKCVHRGE